ncbi:MAG: diguanylate cyclase [Rubellimicrobium sp.]|nr:diguanylate cyclase [Rubellimicrobium sp.]
MKQTRDRSRLDNALAETLHVVPPAERSDDTGDLAAQIMNIMEQGVLVWSAEGRCELHNSRIYQVLEITADDLKIGTLRRSFRERALARGELTCETMRNSDSLFQARQPYSFDRVLPSGRVVLTHARPTRGGGYVVTFTDVTAERKAARELAEAKRVAEAAEVRAREVLAHERARQHEAKLLGQLDEWLQSCKSLDELYQIVRSFMLTLLPGSKGELYIYSNSRDVLDGTCNWNTRDLHNSIMADSCWGLRRGRSYEFRQGGLCFPCDHVTGHGHEVAVNEYICVPIVAHGDTVGLLHIRFDDTAPGAARIEDKGEFAIRCGEHISLAIANAKLRDELRDQSVRDPLTGLFNRRYFLDALRREIGLALRRNTTFGVIAFDADRFKEFNDNHGHDAGDMVLRAIGNRLQEMLVNGEVICRFGGEEFAVLLPEADLERTAAKAELICNTVAGTQVRYMEGQLPRVTVSAGVASFPISAGSVHDLLKRADEALYAAKEAGRNCVRMAGSG